MSIEHGAFRYVFFFSLHASYSFYVAYYCTGWLVKISNLFAKKHSDGDSKMPKYDQFNAVPLQLCSAHAASISNHLKRFSNSCSQWANITDQRDCFTCHQLNTIVSSYSWCSKEIKITKRFNVKWQYKCWRSLKCLGIYAKCIQESPLTKALKITCIFKLPDINLVKHVLCKRNFCAAIQKVGISLEIFGIWRNDRKSGSFLVSLSSKNMQHNKYHRYRLPLFYQIWLFVIQFWSKVFAVETDSQ